MMPRAPTIDGPVAFLMRDPVFGGPKTVPKLDQNWTRIGPSQNWPVYTAARGRNDLVRTVFDLYWTVNEVESRTRTGDVMSVRRLRSG